MTNAYLTQLQELFQKANDLLDRIIEFDDAQTAILKETSPKAAEIDRIADDKDELVGKLSDVNDMIGEVTEKFKASAANPGDFPEQTGAIKKLLAENALKESSVSAKEKEIRSLMEKFIASRNERLKTGRKNASKARRYYASVSGLAKAIDSVIDTGKRV